MRITAHKTFLHFQLVIPFSLSKGLNLINRVILPIVTQFNVTGLGESQNSLSDIQFSLFLSPAKGKVIWGVGPIFDMPTATNINTCSGKFSVVPSGVYLYQKSGWTMGVLINQYWLVGGDPDRGNQTQGYLQLFLAYSWKSGGGFSLNAEMTQNWKVKRTQSYLNFVFRF